MGAPYGWIPTVTPFPRNDKNEWNASVGYIATLKLAMTMVCSFPSPGDCRAYARNDNGVFVSPRREIAALALAMTELAEHSPYLVSS